MDIDQLGCYGVEQTRHGREGVEGGAGMGDEDCFAVRKLSELMIVENRELNPGEFKPLARLPNEVAYVEVGLSELWGG